MLAFFAQLTEMHGRVTSPTDVFKVNLYFEIWGEPLIPLHSIWIDLLLIQNHQTIDIG